MADIFISYARSTAAQAQQIAEALRALGYGVWRDDELPAHRSYAEVIEERLRAAKAVVVVWSAEGVKSEWVQSEADRARNDRKLVQLTVDGAALPMPFDRIQCADLSGWTGDVAAPGWRRVVASIADLTSGVSLAKAPTAQSERAGISVCVLPFANMSGDQEQEYFADGISEDIITDLSNVSTLAVIARNSAFTFKGKHVDLLQVAKQLKVSHILEGSVRKSGNRVRITAQLINGATNDHVWAERYDRNLDDIFALQDEISQAIVAALKLKLFPEEKKAIEDRGTNNTEAFDLYLRARALARTFAPLEIQRAIDIYRRALALDPNFALAWTGLASALERALLNAPETQAETRKAMDEAFSRALALDPDGWTNQLSRATQLFARRDWAAAERAFAKAIDLAPASEPSVRAQYGAFLWHIGRVREGIDHLQSALRAEPLSLEVSAWLQIALYCAGRHGEALAEYERSKDLAGDRGMVEYFALVRMRDHEDAARIKQQFIRFLSHESLILPVHQEMRDVLDQPAAALTLVRRALGDPAYQDSIRQIILAEWAISYGDRDAWLAAWRRALIDLTSTWYATLWMPYYAEARKDPRFKAILCDVGLVDYYRASGKWPDLLRPLGNDDFEVIA